MDMDLERMRSMDVRDVDPETLPDISDIRINTSLPPVERMASVLQQMNGNLFLPLRPPGGQDFLQGGGPAANAPGGLPGKAVAENEKLI